MQEDLDALAEKRAPKPPAGVVIARLRDGEVEVGSAGPVAPDGVFELGSVTKAVTGLLLADAVVRGEVDLDTTLDRCLPGARPLLLPTSRRTPPESRGSRSRCCAAWASRTPPIRMRTRPSTSSCPTSRASGGGESACATRTSAPRCWARRSRRAAARPTSSSWRSASCGPLGIEEIWRGWPARRPAPRPARPARPAVGVRRVRARRLPPRHRARALALSLACLDPPDGMAEAVALALTPRSGTKLLKVGLGWLNSPAASRCAHVVAQRRHARQPLVHGLHPGDRPGRRGRDERSPGRRERHQGGLVETIRARPRRCRLR